ncbi:hypothetical protein E3N88_35455 [Mikania micrantha]|uniref:Uncharacterized protein n=1 Tax=Mikania micrantha TaxID=192012 RepID=A0A5N6M105_9ASTR|nr:hypothetical protein E3N88_35455 [Mikania micrantha]
MEAFNGVFVDKLRQLGLIDHVVDHFDMTYPWHYDNRCNDGVHYRRAPAKMRWRDGGIVTQQKFKFVDLEREMGRFQWMEAMLPLGIIAGMLCIAGNVQYTIHKAAHGRPKHIGNDMWDVAMERRDNKIVDEKLYPATN